MERRELSCGGQTYCGDFGTVLRPGSSLSSTCLAAGRTFPSTTRQEVETGMISGSCSVLALLFWALSAGEAERVNNLRGRLRKEGAPLGIGGFCVLHFVDASAVPGLRPALDQRRTLRLGPQRLLLSNLPSTCSKASGPTLTSPLNG